jgi:hypothetical protein
MRGEGGGIALKKRGKTKKKDSIEADSITNSQDFAIAKTAASQNNRDEILI